MLLTPENAKLLERRVIERLDKALPDNTLKKQLSQVMVQTIIIALQEYERMSENQTS